MAHERIFQLSTEPIAEDEVLRASNLYESELLTTIANYVYDDGIERDEDISSFVMSLNKDFIEKTQDYIIFKPGFRKDHFAIQYSQFKAIAQAMSIEDFTEETTNLYHLRQAIENQVGPIIFLEYAQTFDEFVRSLFEGEKYYFGGVVGFHT